MNETFNNNDNDNNNNSNNNFNGKKIKFTVPTNDDSQGLEDVNNRYKFTTSPQQKHHNPNHHNQRHNNQNNNQQHNNQNRNGQDNQGLNNQNSNNQPHNNQTHNNSNSNGNNNPQKNNNNQWKQKSNWKNKNNFNQSSYNPNFKFNNQNKFFNKNKPVVKPIEKPVLKIEDRGKPEDVTSFISLGGLQEVGKNCYIIEQGNEIILVDAGMRLSDQEELGINCVIPQYAYLKENQHRLKALVITHGHEDHIGAIHYLTQTVRFPIIYAPKLAYNLIRFKLKDAGSREKIRLQEFDKNTIIRTKHFQIGFFKENHSIPDAYGVYFKSSNGTIVSTGDFKFDFTPIDGPADYYQMAKLGHDGVDLLLADSTNALVEGMTMSEKKVVSSITSIFKEAKGRLILSTFASNVFRVQEVIQIAKKFDRKVLIYGRSMEKITKVSREIGYIDAPNEMFIDFKQAKEVPLNKILILCTGSQGEPLAALSRIANGTHKEIKAIPSDTIVFSSNPIPGNTYNVEKIVNKLTRLGANIILNSPFNYLHTSGHAAKEEQKLMQNLMRPKHFCPIHGEHIMLMEHAKSAVECGIDKENTFILSNGDRLILDKGFVYVGNRVEAGNVFVDGKDFTGATTSIISDREKMRKEGIVSVIVALDTTTNKLLKDPKIITKGVAFKNPTVVLQLEQLVKTKLETTLNEQKATFSLIKNVIRDSISQEIFNETLLNPIIVPLIMSKNTQPKVN